jgi:hypothetical protein
VVSGMTHYPQINALHRATRIQLSTTPALLKLSDGKPAKAKLRMVSATGGLLHLPKALAEGDFVEVAFQTQSGNVHGMAEMLRPVGRGQDVVAQPFRFVALGDDDHRILHSLVESADHRSFIGIGCDFSNKF